MNFDVFSLMFVKCSSQKGNFRDSIVPYLNLLRDPSEGEPESYVQIIDDTSATQNYSPYQRSDDAIIIEK